MARYLISFDDGAMDHIPDEDMPAVGRAAHAVVQEALNAGVWVFGGGLESRRPSVVATDGTVTGGAVTAGGARSPAKAVIGGFSIIDVPTREQAMSWAAKIAVACRCAQDVREIMPDPELEAMLRKSNVLPPTAAAAAAGAAIGDRLKLHSAPPALPVDLRDRQDQA